MLPVKRRERVSDVVEVDVCAAEVLGCEVRGLVRRRCGEDFCACPCLLARVRGRVVIVGGKRRETGHTLYGKLQWWFNTELLEHLWKLDVEIVLVKYVDCLCIVREYEKAENAG